MLKIILMTQLYYADGTYEFQNFNVIVRDVQECHELAPKALIIAAAEARLRGKSGEIIQTGHSCTDAQPYYPSTIRTSPVSKKEWSF